MAGILLWTVAFITGLAVLLKSSGTFTSGAEKIGLSIGIPPFIVGVTIVAVGTSLPELISSVLAIVQGSSEIVVGNVIGSNIANICLILGIAGVVGRGIRIDRDLMRVDLPVLAASAAFLALAIWNSPFTAVEGLIFLGALIVYVHFTLSEREEDDGELVAEVEEAMQAEPVGGQTYLMLLGSLILVFLSAHLMVLSIIEIAALLRIGAGFIAVTAVAIGTSLPELAVSLAAAQKGAPEIAVGNLLGSNIFNTFAVMGVPSLLGVVVIPEDIRTVALPTMLLATILYFFITQDREITVWESATLLLLYALFLTNLFATL